MKKINLVVGANNSGKSRLFDFLMWASHLHSMAAPYQRRVRIRGHCSWEELNRWSSDLLRNGLEAEEVQVLQETGFHFIETWASDATLPHWELDPKTPLPENKRDQKQALLIDYVKTKMTPERLQHPIFTANKVKLAAERALVPEGPVTGSGRSSGIGMTSQLKDICLGGVRPKFINGIEKELLAGMNSILNDPVPFTRISVEAVGDGFEVTLENAFSDQWRISTMGSGVREALMVVFECIAGQVDVLNRQPTCLFLEEPENNLHPRAQRNLAKFIKDRAVNVDSDYCFISTHSPVFLRELAYLDCSSVTLVTKDATSAYTRPVENHFDHQHAIEVLGASPVDLMMAAGVIWVEGPSDVIYLRKWIQLYCEAEAHINPQLSEIHEGSSFVFAFTGGTNLYHHTTDPDQVEKLVKVQAINRNFFFLMDSDLYGQNDTLKGSVETIVGECNGYPDGKFTYWITARKEVENYIPVEALQLVLDAVDELEPPQDSLFFAEGDPQCWWTRVGNRKSFDKVETARKVSAKLNFDDQKTVLDWHEKMTELTNTILAWSR